ncbi:uncharacterized protein K02A2.6-like [Solenopsis invicta]|uniref:uncharacterized protein K02A2.6-like n=1 Tax=Solenopsis invicta TaxID=13686 RepID=UPI00193E1B92|nr:uncharacterized protein K02A2.6-like [Solenopsis invicta]
MTTSEGKSRYGWIYKLSEDRLREELARRGQLSGGDLAALPDRLLRYEMEKPIETASLHDAIEMPTVQRLPPPSPPMRPDSPGDLAMGNLRMGEDDDAIPARASSRRGMLPLRGGGGQPPPPGGPQHSVTEIFNILRKWNLAFSGSRGSDAEAFLVRIEEGRALLPVSDDDLFRCLPFFLSGTAGEHETVADYLTCMQALFDRLSPPWTLEEQLNYAHRNRLPRLQIAIRRDEFRSFASLELLASRIEVSHDAATRYRAPPAPERSLFPELAYRSPKKAARASAVVAEGVATVSPGGRKKSAKPTSTTAAAPTAASTSTASADPATASPRTSTAKCWNCDKIGHIARECGENRRMYCYRCGKTGVTVKSCATCAGNEPDGIRILRRLGIPTLRDRGSRIRTANGQIAAIAEEADVTVELEGRRHALSVCLLPNLVVPCVAGVDFLCVFGVSLDFTAVAWTFADEPDRKYPFELGGKSITSAIAGVPAGGGLSELTSDQERRLEEFLEKHVPKQVANPGITKLTEHRIDVGQHRPVKQRCYLVSPKVQDAIREEVNKMLEAGIIEPSFSEWSNPIVMVKKAMGKYRFCLDFQKINSISKKDAYPLPNMNGILDKLRPAQYISTIDLSQAYFQIPLAKESREITAFSVPGKGLYHFTRMPYGLTGASATFQRLLDKLIGPEMEPHAFAYLDDIVVVTSTFEERLEWLRRVLDKIAAAGLTINPGKCEFCRSHVRYLGFVVQREGLTIDPDKVQPILEYPAPRNLKQLRRFLGMSSWPYLEGYKFTVITDHSSLRWLHHLKNPTGRLARWALELLEYDYEVVHRKGAQHHVPDALSRMFEGETEPAVVAVADAINPPNTHDQWYLKKFREVGEAKKNCTDWKIVDGQLYFLKPRPVTSAIVPDLDRWKLVLPRELREEVLRESHDDPQSGHLGVDKTHNRLSIAYYWPNAFRDVTGYVKGCEICQQTKVEQASPVGLMGRRVIEAPWTVIAADIMGPLPRSKNGYSYLLVIQDLFTKWVEYQALRTANGKKIREALENLVLSRWGTPKFLLTDNGTEFVNQTLRAFAQDFGITHTTVPPYHPQANPVERVNRVLKTMIIAFLDRDHRDWDLHIHDFRFAYNTAHHSSIGTSPAFLNLGRELEPINSLRRRCRDATEVASGEAGDWSRRMQDLQALHAWVSENLEQAYQKQAYYNKHRRDKTFGVGELVLKRQHVLSSAAQNIAAKLSPKFHGPFRVSKALSPVVYELTDLDGTAMGKAHIKDLKVYHNP